MLGEVHQVLPIHSEEVRVVLGEGHDVEDDLLDPQLPLLDRVGAYRKR